MSADTRSRLRAGAKLGSGVIMILLVLAALGPAKWAPRTELGWQFDHFIGYFGITLFVLGLAAALCGRGSHYGCRGAAGSSASPDTGSIG